MEEDKKMAESRSQAEQSVIGSLMINNSAWDEIGDYIREEDFYTFSHKILFKTIATLAAHNKPFDILTMADLLKQTGELEIVGGQMFLFDLARNTPTAANVKAYAEIVKRTALDRRLVAFAHDVITDVQQQKENRIDKAQHCLNELAQQTTTEIVHRATVIPSVLEAIDERRGKGDGISGLSTGFLDLDKITSGLQKGQMIVLGARPSMGKTALTLNIADHVAIMLKKTVALFSLEMSKEELIERSLASLARVDMQNLRSGNLTQEDAEKITKINPFFANDKLIIDDRSSVSLSDIRAKCRRIKRDHGLDLVIVDYITLMSGEGENETIRIGNISRGLKLIARDLEVPVIAISQLNRGLEQRADKRPTMADLRQSGAIEQDADMIIFIYREEVYNQSTPEKGKAEIIIAKQRNGATGTINLTFTGSKCRFDNYTPVYNSMYENVQPKASKRSTFGY